ncbi:hypothetical protein [Lentzea flava]|uniref:Uncharacterized protein n=1 Tax=Lentzea flava TaxID=103732 RepID=A0ABQ2V925_9PSEU|nr:hypothetical protein [Lentzea flava]GGU73261.1 hypothetical protein GCM10010178_75930 [Lentzea flava]
MSNPTFEVSRVVRTGAGMCGIWQPEHFEYVTSLDEWEDEVSDPEALEAHIEAGAFVPLDVGGDGVFQLTLRVGGLNAREGRYVLVSSDPYLLISRGSVALGGLEDVGPYAGGADEIALGVGRYMVIVHLIDWKAEPGSMDGEGRPTAAALPDFLVEVAPEAGSVPITALSLSG